MRWKTCMNMDVIYFTPRESSASANEDRHHWLLPKQHIRALLIGPSGCGKTNMLLNIVLRWIKWERLFVIGPTLEQPIYDSLRDLNTAVAEAESAGATAEADPLVEFLVMEDAPDPEDLPPASCIVFDDCMLEINKSAARLFSRGRHRGADVLYLTQKYTEVPKVLRDNVNMILLFDGVDSDAVLRVYKAWCSGDMSLDEFKRFSAAANEPFSFTVISLAERPFDGKYRQRFETFYTPERYLLNRGNDNVETSD